MKKAKSTGRADGLIEPTDAEIEREQERQIQEAHQELGRRILAAVLSYHLGDALNATYKTLKDKEISESWVRAGLALQQGMVNNMFAALVKPAEPPEKIG